MRLLVRVFPVYLYTEVPFAHNRTKVGITVLLRDNVWGAEEGEICLQRCRRQSELDDQCLRCLQSRLKFCADTGPESGWARGKLLVRVPSARTPQTLETKCNDLNYSKYSNRIACANSVDPDQTPQNAASDQVYTVCHSSSTHQREVKTELFKI